MEKGAWVAIVVALIGGAVTLAVKYLDINRPPTPTVTAGPAPTPTVAAGPTPTPVASPTATEPPAAAPAAVPDLAGVWTESQTGALYRLEQNGSAITLIGRFGTLTIDAQGSFTGQAIGYDFQVSTGDRGRCDGELVGTKRMTVTCTHIAGPPYPIVLNRTS